MLEVLKFIFSSFWVWFGTWLLVVAISAATINVANAISMAVQGKR